MAWSAPLTAVSGTVLTASQWNTTVRDNLNECPTAKAASAGQIFVSDAANSIVARTPVNDTVAATETSTSLTYVDLATPGPTVTAITGPQALIMLTCSSFNSGGNASWMAYNITGATTIAPDDTKSLQFNSSAGQRFSAVYLQSGLTAGTQSIQCKYRTSVGGTSTWSQRRMAVIPL